MTTTLELPATATIVTTTRPPGVWRKVVDVATLVASFCLASGISMSLLFAETLTGSGAPWRHSSRL